MTVTHSADKIVAQRPNLKTILEKIAANFDMPGIKEWIRHIEDPLDYDDPIQRQAIVKKNIQLISNKIALFQKFSGVDPDHSAQYVSNEGNFSREEWESLGDIKDAIRDYEDAVESVAKDYEEKARLAPQDGKDQLKEQVGKPKKRISSHKGWIPT